MDVDDHSRTALSTGDGAPVARFTSAAIAVVLILAVTVLIMVSLG